MKKINIVIAGRNYPLNIQDNEEENIRKVGKKIENMIKDFNVNYDIKDKQDALAMCAIRLGTTAEKLEQTQEKNIAETQNKLSYLSNLLEK